MPDPLRLDARCPHCGHDTMFWGELVTLRDWDTTEAFSCRACGSACDLADVEELAADYAAAVIAVKAFQKEAAP